jgi:hypothetical protein
MVWRHVGVIGSGHRLGATACACHAGACKQGKQSDRDDFHHGYLFFRFLSLDFPSINRDGDEPCGPNICAKASPQQ